MGLGLGLLLRSGSRLWLGIGLELKLGGGLIRGGGGSSLVKGVIFDNPKW